MEKPVSKCSDFCPECAGKIKREYERVKSKEYRENPDNRMKILARAVLNYHVNCGNMERLSCEVCGDPKTEGHHYKGYAREHRLDVKWLCDRHHVPADRLLKKELAKLGFTA